MIINHNQHICDRCGKKIRPNKVYDLCTECDKYIEENYGLHRKDSEERYDIRLQSVTPVAEEVE